MRASGRDTEVGLDHGDRRGALVAGDVHVPQARIEEAGARPVSVRRARRVVAVVDRGRSLGDHDEGRAGVRVPASRDLVEDLRRTRLADRGQVDRAVCAGWMFWLMWKMLPGS